MKNSSTIHIGLDVHKESIAVAFAAPGDKPQWLGDFGSRQCDIDRFIPGEILGRPTALVQTVPKAVAARPAQEQDRDGHRTRAVRLYLGDCGSSGMPPK